MEGMKCVAFSLLVENFSYRATELRSPSFYVNFLNESSWRLVVPQYKLCSDEGGILVALLCEESKYERPIFLDFEISLLNESGSVVSRERKIKTEFNSGEKSDWVWLKREEKEQQAVERKTQDKKDAVTIECRLWYQKKHLNDAIFFWGRSKIGTQRTAFNWRIANFKKMKCNGKKRGYDLKCGGSLPTFSTEVYLEGDKLSEAEVRLDVRQARKSIPVVQTSWKVSVMDIHGNAVKLIEFRTKMFPSEVFQAPTLLTKDELNTLRERILIDDGLNLAFDITFSTGDVLNSVERVSFITNQETNSLIPESVLHFSENGSFNPSSAGLQADLLFMYREKTLSDFELRTGGQTFKVHKNILSARSPVFRVMFSGDMAEASGTGLDVPDVDPDTLESLLTYVYTGTVEPLKVESAIGLYYAADKYEILPLRKTCSEFLGLHVTEDSLFDTLVMADLHQDAELASAVNDFIVSNDQEIIQSKKWEEFLVKQPLLAAKTMRTVLQKTRYSGEKQGRNTTLAL